MKTHEIRELTTEELRARSRDLKSQMMHLRIQKATGQMENKAALVHLKKEVARILTVLGERRLGIRQPAGAATDPQSAPMKSPAKKTPAKKSPAKKTPARKTAAKAD